MPTDSALKAHLGACPNREISEALHEMSVLSLPRDKLGWDP
jgi:hypothetical protein